MERCIIYDLPIANFVEENNIHIMQKRICYSYANCFVVILCCKNKYYFVRFLKEVAKTYRYYVLTCCTYIISVRVCDDITNIENYILGSLAYSEYLPILRQLWKYLCFHLFKTVKI